MKMKNFNLKLFVHEADGFTHRRILVEDYDAWNRSTKRGYDKKYPRCVIPLMDEELPKEVNENARRLVELNSWLSLRKYFKDVTEAQWIAIKQYIFERDGFLCQYCNRARSVTADHVVPFSKLGSSHPSNLVAVCFQCNSSKSDYEVSAWKKRTFG